MEDAVRDDLGVADFLQAVEQDGEIVAVQSRDEIVVTQAGHRFRNTQAGLQAPGHGREERIARG